MNDLQLTEYIYIRIYGLSVEWLLQLPVCTFYVCEID